MPLHSGKNLKNGKKKSLEIYKTIKLTQNIVRNNTNAYIHTFKHVLVKTKHPFIMWHCKISHKNEWLYNFAQSFIDRNVRWQ